MCKLVYWVNIYNDIENHVKNCNTCFESQQIQPREKIIHHDVLLRPWEVLGADIFQLITKKIFVYCRLSQKIPGTKKDGGVISRESHFNSKIIFAEYGILHRLMSDAGSNFVSEKFRSFSNSLNIEQSVSSSYHHQSNGQVEACIKFIKCPIKMFRLWW